MNPESVVIAGALWAALPIALLAGLMSFLSPCVLPIVPGYLGYISGAVSADTTGKTDRRRLLLGVLLFVLGFTIVFVALVSLTGAAAQTFKQYSDLATRILGGIVILMGLVFIGFFGVFQRTIKHMPQKQMGLWGAPLLGIALGVGWTPCMGPTLAAIMSLSWNVGDPGRAALLGVVYSLGLGIPFILLALGFGWASKAMAFFRRHIRAVNIAGGVLLIIMGVLMVTGLWTLIMTRLGSVMQSVQLPL